MASKCCGQDPNVRFDTHTGLWVVSCKKCWNRTLGHTKRKKAEESWEKLTGKQGPK